MASYCGHMSDGPRQLMELAAECKRVIDRAERVGMVIDDGNVIDLLADNIVDASLADLRAALVCSGHGSRFPRATSYSRD